jgi:hypothetical protein
VPRNFDAILPFEEKRASMKTAKRKDRRKEESMPNIAKHIFCQADLDDLRVCEAELNDLKGTLQKLNIGIIVGLIMGFVVGGLLSRLAYYFFRLREAERIKLGIQNHKLYEEMIAAKNDQIQQLAQKFGQRPHSEALLTTHRSAPIVYHSYPAMQRETESPACHAELLF